MDASGCQNKLLDGRPVGSGKAHRGECLTRPHMPDRSVGWSDVMCGCPCLLSWDFTSRIRPPVPKSVPRTVSVTCASMLVEITVDEWSGKLTIMRINYSIISASRVV